MIRFLIFLSFIAMFSCGKNNESIRTYDGRLDANITRISAQIGGTVDSLFKDEGDAVQKGQLLLVINQDRILAQLRQQQAGLKELTAGRSVAEARIMEVKAQLDLIRKTWQKTVRMVDQGAATEQSRDELQTKVQVLKSQLEAAKMNLQVLESKKVQLLAAIDQLNLSLQDTRVISPLNGVVINRFIEAGELAAPGLPLFELADLSVLQATVYLPIADLKRIKLGQKAEIHLDGLQKSFPGRIKWISSEAEFTPKTILTKETRTSLVYAVKINVSNPDHILKIGMPVQVSIKESTGGEN